MAYTKVSSITTSGDGYNLTSGVPSAWKYFFETFLPTVGWTVTLCDPSSANPPTSASTFHHYFLKKTLTFLDGTTDTISFVCVLEPNQGDLHYMSWDGVKATNDSSDPDYGRGSSNKFDDTGSIIVQGAGTYDIWKDDDSDSWVWLKNGSFIGCWLPNGNYIRQDLTFGPTTEVVSNHAHMLPAWDTSNKMCVAANGSHSLQVGLPTDTLNQDKLTNYISLTANEYGIWLGTSNNILMRASRCSCYPEIAGGGELLQVGSSAPYDYYYGMTDSSGYKAVYFNFGTTDPGY